MTDPRGRLIQAEGFGARIETLNATEAFLGSLPGNWYANIREPLINTRNLADLIPLNSVWSGNPTAPCPFYPPSTHFSWNVSRDSRSG
ncbi:type IV secretory pathway VirB4 component [Bradyrhizobium diazoefficiens]